MESICKSDEKGDLVKRDYTVPTGEWRPKALRRSADS